MVLFDEKTRIWRILAVALAIFGVLRGATKPSLWTATQAQVDYSHGLVKRGLFGQVMDWLHIPAYHYHVFACIAVGIGITALVLVVLFAARSRLATTETGAVAAGLFGGSFVVTYMTQLIGYLDITMLVIAVTAIWLTTVLPFSRALLPVLGLTLVGLLVHEVFFFHYLPAVGFAIFASSERSREPWHFKALILASGAIIGLIYILTVGKPMAPETLAELRNAIYASVDFPVREDFFAVLGKSGGDNMVHMFIYEYLQGEFWFNMFCSALVFGPVIALLILLSRRVLREKLGADKAKRLVRAATAASLLPLGSFLIGWDIFRWSAITGLSSFLVLVTVYRIPAPADRPVLPVLSKDDPWLGRWRLAAVVALFISLSAGDKVLFYGTPPNLYPFRTLGESIVEWVKDGGRFTAPTHDF